MIDFLTRTPAIVCLTTASLLLPTAEREKTLVGAANLVVTVFCLTFFVQIVPAVGGATPLLGERCTCWASRRKDASQS